MCAPAQCIKSQAPPAGGFAALPSPTGKRGKRSKFKTGKRSSRRSRTSGVALPTTGESATLVATLRAWRLAEAKKKRLPAFRVLTNRTLLAIADARPSSASALRDVSGVGPKLLKRYAAQLVALCTRPG